MGENLGNYKHIIIWNNNWCDKNGEEWATVQTNFNAVLKKADISILLLWYEQRKNLALLFQSHE